ncbi:T9SS type A sorting domain-containing protein [Thalassobellus sediminis]|uniref:T9SS type A sorting domain-containing protein n=1 Tax=Thalassobellus sediminis TaxID=3367753 RepID=UPI0037B2F0BB
MKLKKLLLSTSMGIAMCAAGAQTLPSISGLVMHLDASTITATDGDAIATWADASGLSNDATAIGTGQPTYVASSSAFNNKATLSFDGIDDWIDLADPINSANFTAFIVANVSTNAGDAYLFSGYDNTGGNGGAFDGGNRFRIANYNGNANFGCRMGSSGDFVTQPYDANPHTFVINSNGNAWVDDLVTFGDNNGSEFSSPNIRVGAIQVAPEDPKGFLPGEVAEVIIYNTSLSDVDVASVTAYLQSKYFATAGIEDFANSVDFKAYPNPTSSNITIKAKNGFTVGATLNVYDVRGRILLNKTLSSSSNVVNFSSLPSGSYFVKVSNKGETVVKQITKR